MCIRDRDNYVPQPGAPENPSNPLDRWILSSLAQMTEEITTEMDAYNLQKAATRFSKFIDDLTNWYIRRSRRRFWKSQNDGDKLEAYRTLHHVLLTFCKVAAPFIPFTTDAIYRNLRSDDMPESVHLCDFPAVDSSVRCAELEEQMRLAMLSVSLGRYLRTQSNLKVRQPLSRAIVVTADASARELLNAAKDIIAEELNVKSVEISGDESALVVRSCKANFKTLGPKLGKDMKSAAAKIAELSDAEIAQVLNGGAVEVVYGDGKSIAVTQGDLVIQRTEKPGVTVATDSGVTVALETVIPEELKQEGIARELVSKLQNIRKERDYNVSDRVNVRYNLPEEAAKAVQAFASYIANEVLVISLEADSSLGGADAIEVDLNGFTGCVTVEKA